MMSKIFNSETISTTEPMNDQVGEQGLNPKRTKNKHLPHLAGIHQHTPPIADHAKSFEDATTDALSQGCGILQNRIELSA